MQFKQYPSYKNSGVEWLGDVPEHWNLKRFGYLFDENKKKNIGLKETNFLSLSYGNIKEKNIDDNKGLLPESFETYQIIEPNNIVFRFTDLQNDKRSLRSAISKYHGIITSAYIAVKTKQNADFYNYLFRAYDLQKVFYSMGEGMRQSLKMDELNKMPVVLPNKDEQKRIVSFLDTETARIDNLIAKQEKLIELLEEQRKSIISHAVTKGLNPNAPMKDSGVEWLGEVPEHWEAASIKYLCKIDTGNKDTVDALDDGLYPFFVRSKKIETINEYAFDGEAILTAGDGAGVGKIYHYINGKFNYHQRVYKMSHFTKVSGKFFFFYFSSLFEKVALDGGAKSTVDSLRKSHFDKFIMAIPTSYEQQKIVEYIEQQANKIDFLIEKQNQLIEKLKEYRTSIISHAVTGKIDVREFGA
ncbi:restriction endonuclease subunit S [Advenella alkanexedens]|uniref:restriction endonuclease subunit S n=1 Tax=Advenella alkanexedens TaxID=1481665 RepID=UPI0026764A47|nr:restriction endonuclease subunit S [Advenella alkanexedens]WKU18802.1 restriction endonuclease subunit S [Advenella alkanexedens]